MVIMFLFRYINDVVYLNLMSDEKRMKNDY